MPNALRQPEALPAKSMKSEFRLDRCSEIEQILNELDDDLLDIIEMQIIALKVWYQTRPQTHNKGPIAYELLSQIIDD
jgi:hypothetical protein